MQSLNVPPEGQDYWESEDSEHSHADWVQAVIEGKTRAGYWEWAQDARELTSDLEGQPEV